MLRPRIIPCLLIKNKGLIKTVRFREGRYVGDPINAVRIYNEKEADELIVLDIAATVEGRPPDFNAIERIAVECRMPVCYGGGVKTIEHALKILALGIEKIAISSAAVSNPGIVAELAARMGSQSVVAVLDVGKDAVKGGYRLFVNNARTKTNLCPFEFAVRLEKLGVGELVINSIDGDGVMKGYDFALLDQMRSLVTVPLTALGGAGSLKDIGDLIRRFGLIGAGAGSLFVFKGSLRAVLINYPSPSEKERLFLRPDCRANPSPLSAPGFSGV